MAARRRAVSQGLMDQSQIVLDLCAFGIERRGSPDQLQGIRLAALLMGGQSQEMQRLAVVGIDVERRAVACRGAVQIPGPMLFEALLEELRACRVGRGHGACDRSAGVQGANVTGGLPGNNRTRLVIGRLIPGRLIRRQRKRPVQRCRTGLEEVSGRFPIFE